MIKMIKMRCPACSQENSIQWKSFETLHETVYQCKCGFKAESPTQKFFWLSDNLHKQWKYLPMKKIFPISRCDIQRRVLGFQIVSFAFRFNYKRKIYRMLFDDHVPEYRQDSIDIYNNDDLWNLNLRDYFPDEEYVPWSPVTFLGEFIQSIIRWNREEADFDLFSHFKITNIQTLSFPRPEPSRRALSHRGASNDGPEEE